MNPSLRTLPIALCVATLLACGESKDRQAVPGADGDLSAPASDAKPVEPAPAREREAVQTSAPVAGPDEAPTAAPPAEPDQATPAPVQEPNDGERLLRAAAARYAAMRSMQAEFAMETRNPLLRETVRSRATLFQQRPDRILLRFEEPAGDVIVGDGQYIWVWYPSVDSTQVTRLPAASGAGSVDLLAQFVGNPMERFRWSYRDTESVAGRPATIIELDPLGEEAYRRLVVWIDHENYLVHRFEVTEHNGVERRIDLRNIVVDPDLPDSLFEFDPPAGARIIGRT